MNFSNTNFTLVVNDFMTLKKLRRTGWQLRGIEQCESIADHCFGVVLLTHLLSDMVAADIDKSKAVSLAIVHELGECRVGDISFTTLKYFKNKKEMELSAVKDILSPLDDSISKENLALFEEFEAGITLESRFVRAIDKFEMLVTAAEYEKTGYRSLKDFWDNDTTFECFKEFPEIMSFTMELRNNREKRLSGL